MAFRNQRRRRVLNEESVSADSPDDASLRIAAVDEADSRSTSYASARRTPRERALHDLVPTRYLSIALIIASCLSLVAIVEGLHLAARALAARWSADALGAFDLAAPRNVSHWLGSTLLVMTALAALFVYSLRRHRADDYHGRYRVWIGMALAALVASLTETTDVGRLLHEAARRAAISFSLDPTIVWPAGVTLLVSLLMVRVLIEVRRCSAAVASLAVAALNFLAAAAINRAWLVDVADLDQPMAGRGLCLTGYIFMLATCMLFARHVVLQIEGVVAAPPIKPRRTTKKQAAPVAPDATVRPSTPPRTDLDNVEAATESDPPVSLRAGRQGAGTTSATGAGASTSSGLQLSRTERRQMRREQRRMAS